jgi:hypothetical protein
MRVFGKLIVSAAALAVAGSLTFGSAGAVPTAGKMAMSSSVVLAAEKKAKAAAKKPVKAKKTAKAKGKKAGPGSCGVMKYWDKKTRSCADATTKKS